MTRYIAPACLLASIGAVWFTVATHRWISRTVTRHVNEALAPSNVVRLDSRRKAGANVTVLRSAK